MDNVVRVGMPGKFDPTFGLVSFTHIHLSHRVFAIVWRDTGERVLGIGCFVDPTHAEDYVKKHRKELIDKEFEQILLVND